MADKPVKNNLSIVDPMYEDGDFYAKATGGIDAAYKVEQLCQLLDANPGLVSGPIFQVADIGCGTGATSFLLQERLAGLLKIDVIVDGYDVHPHVADFVGNDVVGFIPGDFVSFAKKKYDLAVLFDVIEHVPDPIGFLEQVSEHADLIGLHIPVEDSVFSWLRDMPRKKLSHPGHLLVLDIPAALNLLAFAGLRVIDFGYSPGFRSPSGQKTLGQKLMYPIRALLFRLSPYVVQRLLAGVSISVLTRTNFKHRRPA